LDVWFQIVSALRNVRAFRRTLLRWFSKSGRDLPWRRTRDPYAILVSEFMLQQTQVGSVLAYYNEWLRRFPNFAALAAASENDVLHAWQGLGYYARVRNLHVTGKIILDRYRGRFPRDIALIRQLPGVGRYTAHAVASFAFDQPVPIVEANTARVLARLFNWRTRIDHAAGRQTLWNHAATLVPKNSSRLYNSALVDLGALICLPRPRCDICPVKRFCRATNPEALPIKKRRPQTKELIENHAFIISQNKILLQQADRRWRGMWILPPLPARTTSTRPLHTSIFPFTHHRVTLRIFPRRSRKSASRTDSSRGEIDKRKQNWFRVPTLDSIPIPSPHRRAIIDLLH
jgi:A/G-specific adenine glycosylase